MNKLIDPKNPHTPVKVHNLSNHLLIIMFITLYSQYMCRINNNMN